jgi:UDP-N-acetylglucosamine--N-acetylmuramyl-(pentapeptide) pyrophosphoryl-undecaprenol N-acetylglucosamine transferase
MVVLFYAVNGLGLGHLTRLLAVARKLKADYPSVEPLFFTSSEAAQVVFQEGFACYKVPSKTLARSRGISQKKLALSYLQILHSLLSVYQPDALVVDTFPLGALQELTGILAARLGMKKIFVHREQKQMTPQKVELQRFYDLILAPHTRGEAHIPVPNPDKLVWTGEILIRSREELIERSQAQKLIANNSHKKLLLLNLGGGGDLSTPENYQTLLTFLARRNDIEICLPQPPLATQKPAQMPMQARSLNYYPLSEVMLAFDAAISAAGYNTFHELLQAQVPTIFIPKQRGYDDQQARAQKAQQAQLAITLAEENLPQINDYLDQLFENQSQFKQNLQALPPMLGAKRAADAIAQLLGF